MPAQWPATQLSLMQSELLVQSAPVSLPPGPSHSPLVQRPEMHSSKWVHAEPLGSGLEQTPLAQRLVLQSPA
jgi:hypothetical protein